MYKPFMKKIYWKTTKRKLKINVKVYFVPNKKTHYNEGSTFPQIQCNSNKNPIGFFVKLNKIITQ